MGQADTDTNSTSPQITDAALKLLSAHADAGRFFLWVHYFDPHAQYVAHAGAPDFGDPSHPKGWKMRAAYDGEVWFVDQAIGRLLAAVRAAPWGKRTVVAVTSDHGEAMTEHGLAFQHGFEIWEPLMRVPLLLSVPGVEPRRIGVKRSTIDLVPTLLDLLRIPQPPAGELSGRSLVPDLVVPQGHGYEERDVLIDMPDGPYTHMRRGLIHGPTPGMKLVHYGGRHYALYDLARDPDENDDLSSIRAPRPDGRAAAAHPGGPEGDLRQARQPVEQPHHFASYRSIEGRSGRAIYLRRKPEFRTCSSRSRNRCASARTRAPVQPSVPRPSVIVVLSSTRTVTGRPPRRWPRAARRARAPSRRTRRRVP